MVENLQYGKCLFQEVINEGCQGLWQEMMCKSSSHHVLEKHFGDTLMSPHCNLTTFLLQY